MAEDQTPIAPPQPRSTETWFIPKVVKIEGDGIDPRKTMLTDAETGQQLGLPVQSLTFQVTAHEPNSMEIVIDSVALRAEVHMVRYFIDADSLSTVAAQNGFEIFPVPAYPSTIVGYGPAEHMFLHRDLPGYQFVQPNPASLATIAAAGANLRQYLDELVYGGDTPPAPTEPQEGEFIVYALKAKTPA